MRARSPWEPPAPGGEPTGATPESESPAGTRGPPTGAGTAPGRPEDGPGMNCGKNQEDSRLGAVALAGVVGWTLVLSCSHLAERAGGPE